METAKRVALSQACGPATSGADMSPPAQTRFATMLVDCPAENLRKRENFARSHTRLPAKTPLLMAALTSTQPVEVSSAQGQAPLNSKEHVWADDRQ